MTGHKSGDLVGVFAAKIQVQVPSDHADGENSYRTISSGTDDNEGVTVTLEGGSTFFQWRGDLIRFDRVTYRPNSDYRNDSDAFTDGQVDLSEPHGEKLGYGHPLGELSLSRFTEKLVSGELEPAERPDGY